MRRYIVSAEAKQDLADIKSYLTEEGGARVASQVLKQLKAAMEFLSNTPGAGHSREDLTEAPLKFWPVFSYLIVYRPAPRPIGIVRVVHGSREISKLLSQDD